MSNEKLREALLSDMDIAVLRMPVDMAFAGHIAQIQYHSRVQSLLNRIEALATTAPAVNQQLTTEPFDERAAFEKWVTKNGEWPNNALRSCLDPDRYVDIQGLWEAWQARAAMAKGVKG